MKEEGGRREQRGQRAKDYTGCVAETDVHISGQRHYWEN